MSDKNKLKLLYDAVSKDYDVGTYDEFETKINDPEKRKAFYDGVGKEYDLGTYEEFEGKVVATPSGEAKKKYTGPISGKIGFTLRAWGYEVFIGLYFNRDPNPGRAGS